MWSCGYGLEFGENIKMTPCCIRQLGVIAAMCMHHREVLLTSHPVDSSVYIWGSLGSLSNFFSCWLFGVWIRHQGVNNKSYGRKYMLQRSCINIYGFLRMVVPLKAVTRNWDLKWLPLSGNLSSLPHFRLPGVCFKGILDSLVYGHWGVHFKIQYWNHSWAPLMGP